MVKHIPITGPRDRYEENELNETSKVIDMFLQKERQQCAERYCNIKCVPGLQCKAISPGHYCPEYNAIIDGGE
jgi:hypothetical protein